MTKRTVRVGERLKEDISTILIRSVEDPRIQGVTITGVDVSPDLRHATVYWVMSGNEEKRQSAARGLESARGLLKRHLGQRLHLKSVPDLRFDYDATLDHAAHIEELLKKVREEEDAAASALEAAEGVQTAEEDND